MAHSPRLRNGAPTDNYTEFSLRSPEGTHWEDTNRLWPAYPVQSEFHLDGLLHLEADDTGSRRVRPVSAFRARGDAAQQKLANYVVHHVAAEVTQAVNKHEICAPVLGREVSIGQCRRR